MSNALPKAWENVIASMDQLPFVVNAIERGYDKSEMSKGNSHSYFEMIYVKKGSGIFTIAQKNIKVGPNDLVMIKPNQVHRFKTDDEVNCDLIVLYFSFSDKLGTKINKISIDDFIGFLSQTEDGPFISIKVSQKNDIIYVMNRLIKEKDTTEIDGEFLRQLLMLELFVLVSRILRMEWQNSIRGSSPKIKELITIAKGYINNHFERELDLATIAGHVFLSPSYFIRAFREETGMSPINYLLKVRIENAKEMLSTTNAKVRDIAKNVGFSNQQRFNEMFRKFTGTTPLEFRRTKE